MTRYTDEDRDEIEREQTERINRLRERAHERLRMIRDDVQALRLTVLELRSDHVYDVELAEAGQDVVTLDTALTNLGVNLAAIAHLIPKAEA